MKTNKTLKVTKIKLFANSFHEYIRKEKYVPTHLLLLLGHAQETAPEF